MENKLEKTISLDSVKIKYCAKCALCDKSMKEFDTFTEVQEYSNTGHLICDECKRNFKMMVMDYVHKKGE